MKNKHLKLSFVFFLLSILFYSVLLFFTPKISVGIIGVDDIDNYYLEVSKSGFDEYYDNYFQADILDIRLNSSNISIQDGFYLNSDFFRILNESINRDELRYDYYLIVTPNAILDFDWGSTGYWGQASTINSAALITTAYFDDRSKTGDFIIQNHAVHEVLHLLGYLHNIHDHSGIMQYTNVESIELCTYYQFQLPVKVFASKYIKIKDFITNAYFKNLVFVPFWILFFLGIEFLIRHIEKKKLNYVVKNKEVILGYNFIVLLFGIFYNYVFSLFALIFFFQIALHLYHLEQVGYLKISKEKNRKLFRILEIIEKYKFLLITAFLLIIFLLFLYTYIKLN